MIGFRETLRASDLISTAVDCGMPSAKNDVRVPLSTIYKKKLGDDFACEGR